MSKLQPVRGTHDLLPEQASRFRHIESTCYQVAQRYGFGEIQTPIFEFTSVFARSVGETSDIVSKEMYVFEDRGGDSLALRPEGTAAIARAFISEGLAQRVPLKLYYSGPMFRYERPQKGRTRQFHQIGAEFFGVDKPQADVEVIAMAHDMMSELGLTGQFKIEINTLGDSSSRNNYRAALVDFLTPLKNQLSEDSQKRLDKNPLRILDSKDKGDQQLLVDAPRLDQHLNEESKEVFAQVQLGLEALGIAFEVNDRLVRGLDYYDHVVFEFTTDQLGAQNAILAGGRYNGLISMMGGKPTAGVGFASGLERLELLLDNDQLPAPSASIAMIPAVPHAETPCLKLAHQLRQAGFHVEQGYSGNMAKRLKKADKLGCSHAVIIGESELDSGQVTIKNFATGEQALYPDALEYFKSPSSQD